MSLAPCGCPVANFLRADGTERPIVLRRNPVPEAYLEAALKMWCTSCGWVDIDEAYYESVRG
jgi:hypothetical protein